MRRARLREDAAEASRARKFVKAEHILRQLLAAERAGSARAKGEEEDEEEEENLGVFAKAEKQTRDDEPRRTAPSDVSDSDSPSSAPVLCLLARALLAQRDSSRRAEASELLRLALRVSAPSDAETRYLALKTLSDASAAEDDPDAAVEAESAARGAGRRRVAVRAEAREDRGGAPDARGAAEPARRVRGRGGGAAARARGGGRGGEPRGRRRRASRSPRVRRWARSSARRDRRGDEEEVRKGGMGRGGREGRRG